MAEIDDSAPPAQQTTLRQLVQTRNLSMTQITKMIATRAVTPAEIAAMPDAALRRTIRRIQFSDLPGARENFRLLHLQGGRGDGVSNRRIRAIHQQASLRGIATRVAGIPVGVVPTPSALAQPKGAEAGGWSALGPTNIGGRTRSIVIEPKQPNTMWAGSVGGGIWRTDDGGANWFPVDDLMANLAVCCLAMDPTNPKIMYAGTGEGFSNLDAVRGAGIFWTNGNNRWGQIAATAGFNAINRIAVSADGKVVLAATQDGLLRSADAPRVQWTLVLDDAIADVRFHPRDPKLAVAGALRSGRAYWSADGGESWNASNHNQPRGGRVELAYAVKNPRVVYASVNLNSGTIWRSQDGGKNYVLMDTLGPGDKPGTYLPANYLGDQGWYANTIWAGDPTSEDIVLVGGLDLWRSIDGGNTLVPISRWYTDGSAHADHHCIVSHPQLRQEGNKTLFFGNDGGIYKTDDFTTVGDDASHAQGWTALDNSYAVTQFYGGAGNVNTGVIIGGTQDNGTIRRDPATGQQWKVMIGGDGGWCAADQQDPNYFYFEYTFLNLQRSRDGGLTAEYISGYFYDANQSQWTWRPPPYVIPDAKTSQALFVAPFMLDPNNSNRILAGGVCVWRTDDAKTPNDDAALTGPSWASIKSSIGEQISAIAIASGDSDRVWVGHTNGYIFKTHDATSISPTWKRVGHDGSKPLPGARYCSSITIDPGDKNIVYVTFAAYRGTSAAGNVWRTEDDGHEWTDMSNSLPDTPVHKLTRHPAQPNHFYLGTEIGLFASENSGVDWFPTSEGPTSCPVYDLFWMNNTLVCTTYGRGMFSIDL